jgi:hypothetical protein
MSKDATRIYSTWFSVELRGYCERSFLDGRAWGLVLRGAESDECCEDRPVEGVFDCELGSEMRSISGPGGRGDLEGGGEACDICDSGREE